MLQAATASASLVAKLNPNVDLRALSADADWTVDGKPVDSDDFLKPFNFVFIVGLDSATTKKIADRCRRLSIPTMFAVSFGFYGMATSDFGAAYEYKT